MLLLSWSPRLGTSGFGGWKSFFSLILTESYAQVNLTIQDLLSIPHEHEDGITALDFARTFRDISTDSRTLKPGDLFVAIRGEKFDGHQFLDNVAKEGAAAAIVDETWFHARKGRRASLPIFVVKNTLDAFGALANLYRKKFNIPVLVVAGSNGKTTTKELIAHVLSGTRGVLKTEANFNNQVGLPRMLFQLRDGHEIAILEIGTNHPGEIEWLCKVAEPTHAIITNIGREHLEFFKDLRGVALEEKAAFDYVFQHDGFVFVNMDDRHLRPAAKQFGERCMTYGSGREEDGRYVYAYKLGYAKDGRLELRVGCEGKSFKLRTHLIADYTPNAIAAAVSVGLHFHMRRAEIKAQLEIFRPHTNRLEVLRMHEGITILNDAYNANPDSMESALRTLTDFPVEGRKFVVLGDMYELGDISQKEHRALGRKIAEFGFDRVFFTGKDMQFAWKAYNSAAGKSNGETTNSYFTNKEQLANTLRDLMQPGDAVLIKGSRGMKMEEVVDMIQRG
jgi:UDP-N-acetylmuramoyl-tripeptide--D-alanyl-D-alanine ligase